MSKQGEGTVLFDPESRVKRVLYQLSVLDDSDYTSKRNDFRELLPNQLRRFENLERDDFLGFDLSKNTNRQDPLSSDLRD